MIKELRESGLENFEHRALVRIFEPNYCFEVIRK